MRGIENVVNNRFVHFYLQQIYCSETEIFETEEGNYGLYGQMG